MSIEIREVATRSDLKQWVTVPYSLYKGHQYQVPQIFMDELSYFDRRRNPSFEVVEVKQFLATREGMAVGRVCATINSLEAQKLGWKRGRFGWFESVDDQDVAKALLDAAGHWLQREGCVEMAGPYGFTDLDPEGLLVEGFDRLPTISGSYNFPYYERLLETYGLEKDADYVEYRLELPEDSSLFDRLKKRYSGNEAYRVVTFETRKELLSHTDALWTLLQEAFEPLHGVVPLTKKQTDYYTKKYFSFLDPDFVKLTFTRDGELVGFFLGIPNLSRAFKKASGHLFPTGFYHILKDYRRPQTVDFLLAGVKPGEPSGPITAMMAIEMYGSLRKRGVRYMETNRELEDNKSVNQIWLKFKIEYFRRSRIYKMALG